MSFLTDLFEGNFDHLWTDIEHAPSSLANHPSEILGLGLGAAAIAAPFILPEIGAALGIGEGATALADIGLGGSELADLGVAADVGTEAGLGFLGDAAGAAEVGDALAFAPEALGSDAGVTFSDIATSDLAGDFATAGDVAPGSYSWTAADIQGPGIGSSVTTDPNIVAYEGGGGASSGSWTQTLTDTLKSPWTKLAMGAAPLALSLGMGQQGLPSQLAAAQANATALASQGSNLNAAQSASLTQMRQNAINAARQAMFNQGVQNPEADTRWSQMVMNIDSQVTAAAQTMIQQNIQNSLQGDQQLIQIAQLQMQSDQNFANMLLNATKALGTAAGLGGGTTIKIGA